MRNLEELVRRTGKTVDELLALLYLVRPDAHWQAGRFEVETVMTWLPDLIKRRQTQKNSKTGVK